MVQVDLITGFLGAGKTTFLRRYAAWWAGQGVRVCVLENDFGAVNVDAMLLQDLEAVGVEVKTISGGCVCDTHQHGCGRSSSRWPCGALNGSSWNLAASSTWTSSSTCCGMSRSTAGISWGMSSPSWTLCCLRPSRRRRNISSPPKAHGRAGKVLLSRCQLATDGQKEDKAHLARALEACKCSRKFGPEEILAKDWADLTTDDMARIAGCGYRQASCGRAILRSTTPLPRPIFSNSACPVPVWNGISRPSSAMPPAAGSSR